MESAVLSSLPKKITVKETVSSRYDDLYRDGILERGVRPAVWEHRRAGQDVVVAESGERLALMSDGQQSPPQPGWILMIIGGDADEGYCWTLYGLPALSSEVTH